MTYTIRVARINRNEVVDFDALPAKSKDFVINYGLKQLLNDSIVSGETDSERNGLLDKKLDKLFEGTLDVREGGTRESDPLARAITRIATGKTAEHFRKLGIKTTQINADDWKVILGKFRVHPKIIALAEKEVAESADITIEL